MERLTKNEFDFILSGNGLMIGVYVNSKLIAVRALLVPKDDPNHLGLTIGLKEDELDKVIYQEISLVHPDYQGNGLQIIMAKLIMDELDNKEHPCSYVCATVATDNIPSLKDKFEQSMEIRALVTIYGEKQRYVFAKKLDNNKNIKAGTKEAYIDLAKVYEVKKYLDSNWIGIELLQESDHYFIKFIQY